MSLLKKIIIIIYGYIRSLDPISHRILYIGTTAAGVCYAAACFFIIYWQYLFTDYETAFYWSGEIINLAKELIGASYIPVLLFEMVLIVTGDKIIEK